MQENLEEELSVIKNKILETILEDKDDIKWFLEMMNDTENTSLQVWSNDIGDEVCKTNSFKWKILTELK